MSNAAEAFARALETERQAALCADLDTLLRVQEEKRELMPLLKASADEATVADLSERARKNLGLIRHLAQCLQGMLGAAAESGYDANGQTSLAPGLTNLRGRL